MKITDVITHQLSVNVDEPFTSSRCWVYKTKGALVHKLIGGAFRSRVEAYANRLHFKDMKRRNEEAVAEAQGYVEQGFRVIKMKIGLGPLKKDLDCVAAVRDAIGREVLLMVDANHCFNLHAKGEGEVPTGPGLGNIIDRSILDRYRVA